MLGKLKNLLVFIFTRTLELATLSSKPRIYCLLLNLRAYLDRRDTRFSHNRDQNFFTVREGELALTFSEKVTNFYSYAGGITARRDYMRDTYLLDKIHFSNSDTVVDCGANVGDLFLFLSSLELGINYIGIEPSPREFFHLEKNVSGGNNYNVGLWNENSEINFFISSRKADSSFIQPSSFTEEITVRTCRLDDLLKHTKIKLLKLEAEGAEFQAILGAEGLLDQIEFISADLGEEAAGKSTLPEVVNYLLGRNFEIVNFGFHRTIVLFKNLDVTH
jgi:FkbM family methyltransferase